MRIFIISIAIMMLLTASVFAEEKIIKVGENDVEVQTIYYKEAEGQEPFVYKTESYGQDRIDNESTAAQSQLNTANNLDCAQYKQSMRDEAQKTIDKLGQIQTEMQKKKAVGRSVIE